MARRRYISTAIGIDKRVAGLSDAAALFWTWMIPHAEDDATLAGDPDELRWTVAPSRPGMDVAACLAEIARERLIVYRDGVVYFDSDSFYRYQSNIPQDKRADHSALFCESEDEIPANRHQQKTAENSEEQRESAENSEEQQESAENAASLSLSLSLSPPLIPPNDPFEVLFWPRWPKGHGSKKTARARFNRQSKAKQGRILAALDHLLTAIADGRYDTEFLMRAENFVGGQKAYFEEWANGPPEKYTADVGGASGVYDIESGRIVPA